MTQTALPQALAARAQAGTLGHAWILTGAAEERLEETAKALAAAFLCQGDGPRPCGGCKACRKVDRDIHPDFQWVEKPADKREILVSQVRALRSDVYIRPNEGRRKVYALKNAWQMNEEAQNAFLKVLEEGPAYGVFLLLSENHLALLPTVRSRCELLRLTPGGGEDAQAAQLGGELAERLLAGDRWELLRWCVPFEKGKREEVLPIWQAARQAVLTRGSSGQMAQAAALARVLGEVIAAGERNGNMGALWGRLLAAAG